MNYGLVLIEPHSVLITISGRVKGIGGVELDISLDSTRLSII